MRDKIIFAFDEYIDSIGYVQSYKFYSSSKWLSQQVHSMKFILGRCSKLFDFIQTRILYYLRSLWGLLGTRLVLLVQSQVSKIERLQGYYQGSNDLILRAYLGYTKIFISKLWSTCTTNPDIFWVFHTVNWISWLRFYKGAK